LAYDPTPDVASAHPVAEVVDRPLSHALGVYRTLQRHAEIKPDLVVAHGSYGSSLFLPYLYDCPVVNFFEYFYRPVGQDLGYHPEQVVTETHLLRCKAANAMTLLELEDCDLAWCPTEDQRRLMPSAYRRKVEVVHDGIDTSVFKRDPHAPRRLPDGTPIDADTRIVTYATRGFEMIRGFDTFMKAAKLIYPQYPNVLFVVAGTDKVFYGSDGQRGSEPSFRERLLKDGDYDLSKFRFVGKIPQAALARLFAVSDLHVYLTAPFFTSWSPLEAMSSGCVLLASDQSCVRQYLTPGVNGLLCGFLDAEDLAQQAVAVLKDPPAYRPLGQAARRTIEQAWSIDVTLPKIRAMLERAAAKGPRTPSRRAEALVRPAATRQLEEAPCGVAAA
jgi:glycosyltransferase involved in cell wall biosynthesis